MNSTPSSTRSLDLQKIIVLARRNIGGNMESSARACLADAIKAMENDNWEGAAVFGLRSLAYSVGILHSSYSRAFKASGISGDVRLVNFYA